LKRSGYLRVARRGAVKARTTALNQLPWIVVSAPQELRDELAPQRKLRPGRLLRSARRRREAVGCPLHATRAATRPVALRVRHLDAEIAQAGPRGPPLSQPLRGDRAANNALYTIVLCRMRYDQGARDYVDRRTKQGLGRTEIIRCLRTLRRPRGPRGTPGRLFKILNSRTILTLTT
jgi:hypothetical protein